MIGCSFVVDREYFGQIGLLDPGMEVYGGENIELGMRVREETNTLTPAHTTVQGNSFYASVCSKIILLNSLKSSLNPMYITDLQFI